MTRAHNFCAGPCTLPTSVLAELADEMVEYGDSGMSVIEMSHRSAEYEAIHFDTIDRLRRLYAVPEEFDVLLLQGGATLLFAMIPMNLAPAGADGGGRPVGYALSGSWAKKAFGDAATVSNAYAAWTEEGPTFTRMPTPADVTVRDDTAYLHVTSNETIEGTRMPAFDGFGARLVADMSSDYLTRPVDWSLFDMVYGGAQKNLGPAGLGVVFVRSELARTSPATLPSYLRFDNHAKADSLFNTPPVFSVWATGKMLAWMEANGGLAAMEKRAAERSGMVYDAIDGSGGFYRNPVEPAYRSHTNVVFRLPSPELEADFLVLAEEQRLLNLKGHRSVGGIRASIYNGLPTESVEALVGFMRSFAASRG